MPDTLLIIEDEALVRRELSEHFAAAGWEVVSAASLAEARQALFDQRLEPLVVLSDMNLPDGNSLDLLEQARAKGSGGEWIFLTGYGRVPDSVRALQLGAIDFLEKPCDHARLDLIVAGAARGAKAQRRLEHAALAQTQRYAVESFLGRSAAARKVRELLAKLATVPFSALVITGETGTGKGLVARILHYGGQRAAGPLVELNCAAIPRELMESELFGHEAGAFTGARSRQRGLLEQAAGGTLFLDEIGEMDLDMQAKLLKAVEDRAIRRLGGDRQIRIDIQLIAASNRDLAAEVSDGAFRADLFHRLNVFEVRLPPLRERKEDLDDLVPEFVAEFNAKAGKRVTQISESVWERLHAHDWPGNVRELRNIVERCVLFAEGEEFPGAWLQVGRDSRSAASSADPERLVLPLDGSMSLDGMEEAIIRQALERAHQNVAEAARLLGTTRETLRYRIRKHGLKP